MCTHGYYNSTAKGDPLNVFVILEEDKVRTIILSIVFHLMEEWHKVLIEAEGKILGLFAQIITRKLRSTKRNQN